MNTNYYGFLIEKYGKWKINKKERVLIFSQDCISYYPLPDDKEFHQALLAFKNDLKSYEKKNIQELLQRANLTNEMKEKFPKEKRKGEISYKNLEGKAEDENRMILYDRTLDKDKRKEENKEWDCMISTNEYELMKKIRKEFDNNKSKNEKDENKGQRKADESQNNKITSQNNQFTNYRFFISLETLYQILWDEYYKEKFNLSKKPGKLAELELSIQIVVNEFTKYCERLVQVILSYLKPDTFNERGGTKIIPILLPSLTECDTKDHYLIFYFFGVTITMTWNVITYNSRLNQSNDNNSQNNNNQTTNNRKESKGINSGSSRRRNMGGNRNDEDTKILYGKWDILKANFKHVDSYQNIPPDNINDKSKVLRVPLTCLIDYCGFRFLCEYDLAGKAKKDETQKTETKRDLEECKPDFYQKCLNLFYELFYCNDSKKDGTFQKNDDNYSNRSYLDNNKNGQELEKTPYEKLFDIVNDYFIKQDNNGENNVEQKSGQQNKTIFFQTQLKKAQQEKVEQSNSIPIEYYNINYYDEKFPNIIDYQKQSSQDSDQLFFKKNTFLRPELISSSKSKDNNFGDQNFAHRNDKDELENNKTNDDQNQNKLMSLLEKYLNIFNNSLNSFYFKIYDSETMDNLFHSHGINLISLGSIAEKSESPYIREFCINEMIARTCKKLIFHILAEDRMFPILNVLAHKETVSPSPPPFKSSLLPYKYQKLYNNENKNKNETKEDSNTDWSYFMHLKEMNINLNSAVNDEYKFFLSLWGLNQANTQKNNDETIRNEILNINSAEDKKNPKLMGENEGHNQNKKSTTIIDDDHIKRSKELIAKFLNVLFGKTKESIKIKGEYKNHKELWKTIREEVGNYYKIESKEILIFCKLNCMSLPPFLDALEYHTGIKLDWGKVKDEKSKSEQEVISIKNNENMRVQNYYPDNTTNNFTNRHILSITWKPEDVLEIQPKTKTFTFSNFLSNKKEKNDEYICNYSQLIINRNLTRVENFDKFMLLRFFYEKINRSNNFTLWYIVYFNQLKYDILENAKENNLRTEQDRDSRDSDSKKDEKTNNKNLVYNKNNECIDLYKYIYEELKKSEINNKNTRYDLSGLLFYEEISPEEEMINNKSMSCSLYMQKKFSRLGYIMINITKEIQCIEETNLNLSTDENITNDRSQGLMATNTISNMNGNNELSANTKRQLRRPDENSKDLYEYRKIDGELLFRSETLLKFNPTLQFETQALELIENFYIRDHPYYCDIKELCGKELLTRWKASHQNSKQLEEYIENYFKEAIRAGRKCLPPTNIYLANISLDVGSFYAARNDYLNAVEIYKCAYSPFKTNSQYFQKDYCMFLKRFIKYNIKLGDFKYALELGEKLLAEIQKYRNEKDAKTTEYLNKNLHLERIRYNLALIALKVKDYDKGIKHCQSIFENKETPINNNNDSSSNSNKGKRRKTEYINWQKGKENDYPGRNLPDKDYDAKLSEQEYHLKLKLYMKMIIRSLKDDSKTDYLLAILRFYDSPEEKQSLREEKKDLKEIKMALQGNSNLYDYFKSKILMALKIKNSTKENTTDKAQIKEKEQQNSDYEIFRKLFRYFENDKVFYSFDRREKKNELKNGDSKDKEDDEYDGDKNKIIEKDSEEDGRDDQGEDMQDDENSKDSLGYNQNRNAFG